MTVRNQVFFWSLAFALLMGFVYLFKSVLLPFVLGMAIAYLLNPLVTYLGKIKIKRAPAALLLSTAFFIFVALFLAILIPVLYKQSLQLADDFPTYLDKIVAWLEPYTIQVMGMLGEGGDVDLKAILSSHMGTAAQVTKQVAAHIVAGGQAALNMLSILVLTPIVTYFMMKEWDKLTAWVTELMPRDHKETILDLLKQIDIKIAGFVRGQISIAFILAIAYAVALSIAGLKYGFLIGLISGFISVIPLVGSTLGLIVSIAVAWFQSGDIMFVGIIGGIFIAGQLIEGNILSPKIVGDSVGLHPLWVFFALMAGGALFGILGMLLAVPLAASVGVLLAFAIKQYKASPYFKGAEKKPKKTTKKKAAPKASTKTSKAGA